MINNKINQPNWAFMNDEIKAYWDGVERRNVSELAAVTAKISTLHDDVVEVKGVLRELTAAITKLALVEERQVQFAAAQERMFSAIGKISDRVSELEKRVPEQSRIAIWVDRGIFALAAAALMYVGKSVGLL